MRRNLGVCEKQAHSVRAGEIMLQRSPELRPIGVEIWSKTGAAEDNSTSGPSSETR
jgi:hypothetical protein